MNVIKIHDVYVYSAGTGALDIPLALETAVQPPGTGMEDGVKGNVHLQDSGSVRRNVSLNFIA